MDLTSDERLEAMEADLVQRLTEKAVTEEKRLERHKRQAMRLVEGRSTPYNRYQQGNIIYKYMLCYHI
jgi:hypothetical protein